ncbi:MAG TPA: hypothetical protein PKI62_03675 [bacterium]|nr:hypothetical protein [bacterium]HPR88395.1 hypothetical protein [bacterium]
MTTAPCRIIQFSNQSADDRRLLKKFVDFHWQHYKNEPHFVPLLDYEYLGFKLLGITGFFEPANLFFEHGEMTFFLALRDETVVGRCNAFINHNHNRHWNDKVGFFGQFESSDDPAVTTALLDAAAAWLKSKGMEAMRGPQNLPINEATPGLLVAGFETRPVVYYQFNMPYYEKLLQDYGMEVVKRVKSWEVPVNRPMEEKLERVGKKVIEHFGVTIETWDQRPLAVRKAEMLEVYNDAWNDNWGFVPFTQAEFFKNVDDMQLVMEKGLFLFVYVKGELAAFFGGVPNIFERMAVTPGARRFELLRAAKMILTRKQIKGFRLGYMGVKQKFRRLGLDGVMLWQQKLYSQKKGYDYCDFGWVLEDNVLVIRVGEAMEGAHLSKTYAVMQKPLN